jgi:N-acetylglucosaminyldiphosphoundecaprenol N-acetyl-beta-D-mannosaminyltransferase
MIKKVPLFGFDFWGATNEEEVVNEIMDNSEELYKKDKISFLLTPNSYDIALYFLKYTSIYHSLQSSAVVLADGMPIVWLSKLYSQSLVKRITGSNLFPVLWEAIKKKNKKAYFILADKKIAEKICNEYAQSQYAIPKFFDAGDDAYVSEFVQQHLRQIKDLKPDFIFIGVTIPKQQKIALELYRQLPPAADFNCLIAVLGGSFEFYLGLKKRAPAFFQKSGMEWIYRLMQEPKRLWKRYTVGNLQFMYVALVYLIKNNFLNESFKKKHSR